MRKFGFGVLGLIVGALAGEMLVGIVARIALGVSGGSTGDPFPLPVAIFVGFLTPVMAVVGIVVALTLDSRSRRTGDAA